MPNIWDRFAPRSTKLSATRSKCARVSSPIFGIFAGIWPYHRPREDAKDRRGDPGALRAGGRELRRARGEAVPDVRHARVEDPGQGVRRHLWGRHDLQAGPRRRRRRVEAEGSRTVRADAGTGHEGVGDGAARALEALGRPRRAGLDVPVMTRTVSSLIGGRGAEGAPGGRLTVANPAHLDEVVAEASLANAATFVDACGAAMRTQDAWASVPAPARGRAIQQLGRLVEENKRALATLLTQEIGKPFAESLGEVQEGIDTCTFFLSEGRRLYGQTVPLELADKQLFTFRAPVGVSVIITAGNFPVAVPSWYIVPALLCGNAVVWKPAEYTPATAEAFAQLILHAGLPEGVFNMVLADGPTAFTGLERAMDDGLVDKVGFTGSTDVGRRIGELCGRHFQSPCLELGGKNPLVVMPDADLDLAVEGMTTRGFFPPSSRQGDWKCRPHSSPIRRPTSVEPVNPTLSTSPSSMARSNPVNAVGPSASTMLKPPSGNPAWRISWANASAVAGVYSAGFHTTAFPHSSAGTMYQDGTATGKFPAVMITETPTGARNVNSCLSGSSDGTVCPYSRRPSDWKKAHVSTTSCTSPSDSVNGLPISRVSSVARARLFSSTRRPSCWTARPRTGAGTCAHASCARRAVRQASTNVGASARDASATTSSRCAGFGTVIWPPGAPSTPLPPISDDTVLVMTGTSRPARRGRPTASSARAAPSPTPSWPVPASARTARPP